MSWIQIDRAQESVREGDAVIYRVRLNVVQAVNIESELFVCRVADDQFSHVATLDDLVAYPTNKAQAQQDDLDFYRVKAVVMDNPTKIAAATATTYTLGRLQKINADWGALEIVEFGGIASIVYDSGDT